MKIVIGLNGSPSSEDATRWVAEHGPALNAEVHAVMAVHRYELWEFAAFQVNYEPMLENWRAELDGRWTKPLQGAGLPVTTCLVRGDPATELCKIAAKRDADLLVIGAKDHNAIHDLLGGTAHKIVNHSTVPVLLVPPRRRANEQARVAS